jgi:ATP-dependent protease HslVU (ClpYQ) ATPase subunit
MKYSAGSINEKISELLSGKSNRKVVSKSLSLNKAIALIEQSLKERIEDLKYYDAEDLYFVEKNGITIIEEVDLPLTTKSEKEIAAFMKEKGFVFSYHENSDKAKYYLCVGTK